MRNTGTPPSRAGLWNWAKQQYTGTRNELLLHFPAEIQGQAGRPRGKSRSAAPTVVVTDASLKGSGTADDPLRVAGIDGGDY
jgi:hypothetical protein